MHRKSKRAGLVSSSVSKPSVLDEGSGRMTEKEKLSRTRASYKQAS